VKAISLLYHDVLPPAGPAVTGFMDAGSLIYKFSEAEFRRHMEILAATGLVPCPNILSAPAQQNLFLLTFDDGGISSRDVIAGILEERGWRGHFFITTGQIGSPGFLSVPALRDLHQRGHVIGSHSCTHPSRFSSLAGPAMAREWQESRQRLEDLLGTPVLTASVPGGYYSRRVAASAIAAGYQALFNSEPVSSVREWRGCRIFGRYSVQRGVSADTAAALATGDTVACGRQYLLWNLKKVAKGAGGQLWLRFRERLLERQL